MGGSSVSHAYSAVTANPKPSEGGHSQEIVPGLKAPTVGWLISPDLNEVRVQHQTTGCNVWPGPERSEGPASGVLPLCTARTRSAVRVPCPDLKHQTTGCNVRPGPERSEGPPNGIVFVLTHRRTAMRPHKAPSQGALTRNRART